MTSDVTIEPWLFVRDGARAVEFYSTAFDADEIYHMDGDDGTVVSKLSVAGAQFWVSDESPDHDNYSPDTIGGCSTRIHVTVPDPGEWFDQVIAAGATEVFPVGEEHGWLMGRLEDPFGHHWMIGRPLQDATGDEAIETEG